MPDKQQIIFISRVLQAGGAEKVVYDLVHNLDRGHYEPHIVCLFEQRDAPISFAPDISIHCIETTLRELQAKESVSYENASAGLLNFLTRKYLKWKGKLRRSLGRETPPDFAEPVSEADRFSILLKNITDWHPFVSGLQRILKDFHTDALLVPIMEEATVLAWLSQILERRPYVASLHSVESYNLNLMYPDPQRLAAEKWMFSNACKGAASVIVPSKGCQEDLISNYNIPTERIKVVPNPVDARSILSRSKMLVPSLGANPATKFVYVGRLDEDKNPGLLIEAAQILKERYDDFVIYCVGKGALFEELQSQIQIKGLRDHVFLLGELVNPYPLMAQARALVLTSLVESFALVLVEAMLCGAVPVAVDCPFGPREILQDGKYGLLVPMNDARALADAMMKIACDENLYLRLQSLGADRAQRYDLSTVMPEWEQIFRTVNYKNGGLL